MSYNETVYLRYENSLRFRVIKRKTHLVSEDYNFHWEFKRVELVFKFRFVGDSNLNFRHRTGNVLIPSLAEAEIFDNDEPAAVDVDSQGQ